MYAVPKILVKNDRKHKSWHIITLKNNNTMTKNLKILSYSKV